MLASQVAQAVIEIHRTKGGMPLFKCKLRCKTLFAGNLDVYFLVDFPNVPLSIGQGVDGKDEILLKLETDNVFNPTLFIDNNRAIRFFSHLEEAIAFWSVCMETEVTKVYTDKTPKQVGRMPLEGIINMKINVFQGKPFDPVEFLSICKAKKAFPAFKIGFGWIASTEDARSEDHLWGFKFDLSTFPQYTESRRVRAVSNSAKESVEASKKKRKAELDAPEVVEPAVVVAKEELA